MSSVLTHTHATPDGSTIKELVLNDPARHNALTLDMIDTIQPQLDAWRDDPSVVAVVLRGAGEKAFCAGGDVVSLVKAVRGGNPGLPEAFFTREYKLDYDMHTYPKPIICWGSGIVMGGGKGLLTACSHRVVTETAVLAMPEVTIALYPDVGGSWFLNRLPGRTGLFVAVTGVRLNAADVLFLGLGNRFVSSDRYDEMLASLSAANWDNADAHATVNHVLRTLEHASQSVYDPVSQIRAHYDLIQTLTDADSVEGFVANIMALETDDPWLQRAQKTAGHGSPLAIKVMAKQLERTRHASLREVFLSEVGLSVQCAQFREFQEGVTALLIEKTGAPDWTFKSLDTVDPAVVDRFFDSPWDANPLASLI
ncbi:MAG: enoyl-CoA hydratase/isomerase family protein [Pseudomonadota bacterium]